MGLNDNHIILMNLELREDLLSKLNIPLVVFEGKIGKIVIKVLDFFAQVTASCLLCIIRATLRF